MSGLQWSCRTKQSNKVIGVVDTCFLPKRTMMSAQDLVVAMSLVKRYGEQGPEWLETICVTTYAFQVGQFSDRTAMYTH